jgi:hypothetical protein
MPWLAAIVGLVLAATLYVVEPSSAGWLPKCPLHSLTGWHCPGCGTTRACHALLHGELARAWACNPLLVVAAPVALAFSTWSRWRHGREWTTGISWRWLALVGAVLLAFAVLRNIPIYPFELLAPH